MAHKTLIGGTTYEISGGKTLIGGTAYSIKNGKTLVGGTAYEIGFGVPIGSLEVGSSVFLNVDGIPTEFIVVHQGIPDSPTEYDDSCNGTWLLMKDAYVKRAWHSSNVSDYENSDIHNYLNTTFLNLLDGDIQSAIKQATLVWYPYDTTKKVTAKVFLLTGSEVNLASDSVGHKLDYFSINTSSTYRICYINGVATDWWLRTAETGNNDGSAKYITYKGGAGIRSAVGVHGIRPALILPSETIV